MLNNNNNSNLLIYNSYIKKSNEAKKCDLTLNIKNNIEQLEYNNDNISKEISDLYYLPNKNKDKEIKKCITKIRWKIDNGEEKSNTKLCKLEDGSYVIIQGKNIYNLKASNENINIINKQNNSLVKFNIINKSLNNN